MTTHDIDIELPPLPEAHIVSYQTDSAMRRMELRTYSGEDMKAYALAAIEADRKRRGVNSTHTLGEPVGYIMPTALKQLKAGGNAIVGGTSQGCDVPIYTAPQPAESCASLMSDKPVCGSENEDCDSQPAEPEHATLNLQPSSSLQPVATAFFTEQGEVAYTGIYDRTLKALEAVKTTRLGISSGSIDLYAAPVKPRLKVSYDDKYDVLYVDCDSNEPFEAEEDDMGILYRRAISDGRLVGITISNFMGPLYAARQRTEPVSTHHVHRGVESLPCYCKGKDDHPIGKETLEPVKVPSDGDIMIEWASTPNTGDMRVDLVVFARALLARYGQHAQPSKPVKVPSDDLAHEIWAAAQTAPGEGIEDAVERVAALLARYGGGTL